ncbi:uncharacterized protein LOC133737710 [Rosa rugosa]|uniref:uncharacterized protein LOC133737710 n=1 Tax=Rosa rugosa TaxID=74645 RepID=UPI002B403819|nr:uncharacterized protein LOC133737710 [Rosa rugosa]
MFDGGHRQFQKNSQSYCSGCVLFLQLFYFDRVSHGKTIVDKSLYPVEAWGDHETGKLLKWVNKQGGLLDENVLVAKVGDRVGSGDQAKAYGVIKKEMSDLAAKVNGLENNMCNLRDDMMGKMDKVLSMLNTLTAQNVNVNQNLQTDGLAEKVSPKKVSKKKAGEQQEVLQVHGEDLQPKKKTSLICLSDSTSVVSPLKSMKKVDANPTTKSNIEKIGNFKVKGDREEADKGVLRFVYDVSAEEKETIVDS